MAQESVAKIISLTNVNLGTPKVGAEHEPLYNKPDSGSKQQMCDRADSISKIMWAVTEAVFLVMCDPSMNEL